MSNVVKLIDNLIIYNYLYLFEKIYLCILKIYHFRYSLTKISDEDCDEGGVKCTDLMLIRDGHQLNPTTTKNVDAWAEGATLVVGDRIFTIKRDRPQVVKMDLASPILSGYITLPSIQLSDCDVKDCKFDWFRVVSEEERDELAESRATFDRIVSCDKEYLLKVGDSYAYEPVVGDIGHVIKCCCEPRKSKNEAGAIKWTYSARPVVQGPTKEPFAGRHKLTARRFEPSDDEFRFTTYNILANLYVDQDYSRDVLFAHCRTDALEIAYRRQLFLKEIDGYNSDIICLQEVDKKEFSRIHKPYFESMKGYDAVFHTKGGTVSEGVSTLFRRDRFELIDSHRTLLSRLIDPKAEISSQQPGESDDLTGDKIDKGTSKDCTNPEETYPHPFLDHLHTLETNELLARFESIRLSISRNQQLLNRFMSRFTVLQTTLLKVKSHQDTFLIVANTHLYFAPDADHIRLLQACVCIRYLEHLKDYYKTIIKTKKLAEDEPKLRIIFCGDMNSSPDCGLYTVAQGGSVGQDFKDWSSCPGEEVRNLSFKTNLIFSTAYQGLAYTNYTPLFNGCLDYIYHERDGIDLVRAIPLPNHADVVSTGGIPSEIFPSDHLALVADLKFK